MKTGIFRILAIAVLLALVAPDSFCYYIGQRSRHSNAPSGFGAQFEENYSYFGDVGRGKPEGKGLMISDLRDANNTLSHCPGAVVYYGGWLKGKKEGHGRCYGPDGKLLYEGIFSDDKPVGTYPSTTASQGSHIFGILKMSEGTYTGEISEGRADGFGFVTDDNGNTFCICRYKAGNRSGVSLVVDRKNGSWQVISNNEVIADSKEDSKNKAEYDAKRKKQKSETMDNLKKSFDDMASAFSDLAYTLSGESTSDSETNLTDAGDNVDSKQTESDIADKEKVKPNKKKKKEERAKNKERKKNPTNAFREGRIRGTLEFIIRDYGNMILSFKITPEHYIGRGYTYSTYVDFIKDCQQKAKEVNDDYRKKNDGKDLSPWNAYREAFEWVPDKDEVYEVWRKHCSNPLDWKD